MKKSRFNYLAVTFVTYLIVESIVRLGLGIVSRHDVSWAFFDILRTLAFGVLYDSCTGLFYCLPLGLLLFILPGKWLEKKFTRLILLLTTFTMNFFMFFTGVSLVLFWQEFHTNFNFIAVDYLIYTTEMLDNIWQSYNVPLYLCLIASFALLATWGQAHFLPTVEPPRKWRKVFAGLFCLCALPSLAGSFSQDQWRNKVSLNRYNIELAGNGPYGFVHAFFNNNLDYPSFYVTEKNTVALGNLRTLMASDNSNYTDATGIARRVTNTNALSSKNPNIIIITVESLSSEFSHAFGGKRDWTPQLDKLAEHSYIFTNMLATGTRTVRGLEAISLSLPPTPGQSILRRPNNENMHTLGTVLGKHNYKSDFIYGGYGYFDNMNAFFEGNGYTIKDRVNIPKDEIFNDTVWGVADEILFTQVIKSMDEHYSKNEPAFEMVMTTTNHRPFTFPENRVNSPQGEREGACRYTDWAIADFLKRSANKPWFNNTVFVIVADHQAGAAGKVELPVSKYQIPCLIFAPHLIKPEKNTRLISQMDLAPTLLGMLGISYNSYFMGQDIAKVPIGRERAFISTYQKLGYIQDNKLVVLDVNKQIHSYEIKNWQKNIYAKIPNDPTMTKDAIAYYQSASYLFDKGLL